ncbi:MAG: hypothetical protein RL199_151 [Pseudomonadota bacterium]|jgi:hypothetical protein
MKSWSPVALGRRAWSSARRQLHRLLAAELSTLTRLSDGVWHLRLEGPESPTLAPLLEGPSVRLMADVSELPVPAEPGARRVVLLDGTLNHTHDIEALLAGLAGRLGRGDRVAVVAYNPYLAFLFRWAHRLGLRRESPPTVFVTTTDLVNLCRLAGFEVVRTRLVGYLPWRLLGLGDVLNRLLPLCPGIRLLAVTTIAMLRPVRAEAANRRPSLSIVIPARNERGNIAAAVARLPDLGAPLEVLFVEGHSSDGTWEEIERVLAAYRGPARLVALRQNGKGKADAVRLGFSKATGDLVTILDADLTMPPELLGRFYEAWRAGLADFVNGSRLVYPMEGEAMRFLNLLGNVFFAKALSLVLGVRLGDSLCGTKLLARRDYERFVRWRDRFGDFDPFGDFELLFPAAELALGVVDVPIRYRARTYGTTNISRFRHGLVLLHMTWCGLRRVMVGQRPGRTA